MPPLSLSFSLEISFSPQFPSALKIQDGSQIFCKEILSTILPKILMYFSRAVKSLLKCWGEGGEGEVPLGWTNSYPGGSSNAPSPFRLRKPG